ncbi:Cupin domain [Candidatus Thermokryptus mobilis]|uniref:Cupin domain n=1 Tax=Candidatus Thermokryptus mobilis TaxID=1643428 RepID=A0A0S4MZ54_9BACT|nr:cupin domain-containing protein [Candidatus Thermokryptus mobilis]CUU03619.1 Cupin domain [Candidatus Thermokryptus mobilis]
MLYIEREKWIGKGKEEIERDWAERGFTCDVWVDPPWQSWEDFVHDTDELVTPLNATLEIECEGEIAELKPGDEWFIPRGAVHSVRNKNNVVAYWLYGYNISKTKA